MDSLDTPNQPSQQPDLNQLREQYEGLRQLVISVLILLIMISGAFNVFLLRQLKFVRAELNGLRPQAAQIVDEYQKTSGPAMDDFVKKIQEYGRTHPDFEPIMKKYSLHQMPTGAPPATAKPAAAPAAAAPKK